MATLPIAARLRDAGSLSVCSSCSSSSILSAGVEACSPTFAGCFLTLLLPFADCKLGSQERAKLCFKARRCRHPTGSFSSTRWEAHAAALNLLFVF